MDMEWDLDLLPTPLQVVMGSANNYLASVKDMRNNCSDRLHLNLLPTGLDRMWNVHEESRNSLECTFTRPYHSKVPG